MAVQDVTKIPKRVSPYTFWGVHFSKSDGDEFIGTCPFCRHDDSRTGEGHFFVSGKKGAFDCKSCGKQGSVRTFLQLIYEIALAKTTEEEIRSLARLRKLPYIAVKEARIAKSGIKYFFPVVDEKNEVIDLRVYRSKKGEIATSGSTPGLYGLEEILNDKRETEPIYICEGSFDRIALQWLLKRLNKPGIAVSCPGANNFRDEWSKYFSQRDVIICFDNDDAGYGFYDESTGKVSGSRKVASRLKNYVSSLSFLNWTKKYKDKYDVNDFVSDNVSAPELGYTKFHALIKSTHRDDTSDPSTNGQDLSLADTTPVKLEEVIEEVGHYIKLNKTIQDGIALALAASISQNMPGKECVWLFYVGPPACGKTIILGLFEKSRKCLWESTLTKTGLISGWNIGANQADPSILSKVDKKCLVLKDYTEVLSLNDVEKREIFGILRGAYDKRVRRQFGTGFREYICDFSIIAGVTHEIHLNSTASLGERFLRYTMPAPNNPEAIQHVALSNQFDAGDAENKAQELVTRFLNNRFDFSRESLVGRVPHWFKEQVIPLSRLAAWLRTPIMRHEKGYMMGQVAFNPVIEGGNRICVQLQKLAVALSIVYDKPQIDEKIYDLIKRVAFDTVDSYSTTLTAHLINAPTSLTPFDIGQQTGIANAGSFLEDLTLLKVIEKDQEITIKGTRRKTVTYKPTKLISDLWKRAKL